MTVAKYYGAAGPVVMIHYCACSRHSVAVLTEIESATYFLGFWFLLSFFFLPLPTYPLQMVFPMSGHNHLLAEFLVAIDMAEYGLNIMNRSLKFRLPLLYVVMNNSD